VKIEVAEIARITINPGEHLIIRVNGRLPKEAHESIRKSFGGIIPEGSKVLILEDGMTIEKLKAEGTHDN
jgi:hypothetical protein